VENTKETAGEEFIADFLEEKGIKFKRYPKVPDLSDDDKRFREADFYLPEYKVYVEFLGQWNVPEQQSRYRQKMAVYYKNNVPCVYLWPDNLGTLDWMLRRRIRETLLKHNKKWTLLKYEVHNYTLEQGLALVILGFLIYYVKDVIAKLILVLFLCWILYSSIKVYVVRIRKIKNSKWVSGRK
jgi:hypothetical protein